MFELCHRLCEKICGVVYDVINDVTNDVIFSWKSLILNLVLLIKGGTFQHSRSYIPERASSELSKNHPIFPNRPPEAELRSAQSCEFSYLFIGNGMTNYRQTILVGDLCNHTYVPWDVSSMLVLTENSSAVRRPSYGARKITDFHTF